MTGIPSVPQEHPISKQNTQYRRGLPSTEAAYPVQKQHTQYTDESTGKAQSPDCRLGSICSCCLEELVVAVDPSLLGSCEAPQAGHPPPLPWAGHCGGSIPPQPAELPTGCSTHRPCSPQSKQSSAVTVTLSDHFWGF